MTRLARKAAIVTGAASGIGAAVAERLVAEGARVLATDVDVERGSAVAASLGDGATFRRLDVGSEDDWASAVAAVSELDALVHCGGVPGTLTPLAEVPLEEWQRVMAVNATGSFLALKHCIPAMVGRGGSVVLTGSIFGVRGVPEEADYSAAKAAVSVLGKNAAVTYGSVGVRVNVLLPGIIDTPMSRLQTDEVFNAQVAATPVGRAADAREVAAVAAFLISDDASFVTGVELPVDGGYLARGAA